MYCSTCYTGCLGIVIAHVTPPVSNPLLSKLPPFVMDSFGGPNDVRVEVTVSRTGMPWRGDLQMQLQNHAGLAAGRNVQPHHAMPNQTAAPKANAVQAQPKPRCNRTRTEPPRPAYVRSSSPPAAPGQPAARRTASQAAEMAAKHVLRPLLAKGHGGETAAAAQDAQGGGGSGEGTSMHVQPGLEAIVPVSGMHAQAARAAVTVCSSQVDVVVPKQSGAAEIVGQGDAGVVAASATPVAAVSWLSLEICQQRN